MKIPLFCRECDMITGHESCSWIKCECNRCGNIREIPLFRWCLLILGFILIIYLTVWWVTGVLGAVGIL
jgi:hypothetical protein